MYRTYKFYVEREPNIRSWYSVEAEYYYDALDTIVSAFFKCEEQNYFERDEETEFLINPKAGIWISAKDSNGAESRDVKVADFKILEDINEIYKYTEEGDDF